MGAYRRGGLFQVPALPLCSPSKDPGGGAAPTLESMQQAPLRAAATDPSGSLGPALASTAAPHRRVQACSRNTMRKSKRGARSPQDPGGGHAPTQESGTVTHRRRWTVLPTGKRIAGVPSAPEVARLVPPVVRLLVPLLLVLPPGSPRSATRLIFAQHLPTPCCTAPPAATVQGAAQTGPGTADLLRVKEASAAIGGHALSLPIASLRTGVPTSQHLGPRRTGRCQRSPPQPHHRAVKRLGPRCSGRRWAHRPGRLASLTLTARPLAQARTAPGHHTGRLASFTLTARPLAQARAAPVQGRDAPTAALHAAQAALAPRSEAGRVAVSPPMAILGPPGHHSQKTAILGPRARLRWLPTAVRAAPRTAAAYKRFALPRPGSKPRAWTRRPRLAPAGPRLPRPLVAAL